MLVRVRFVEMIVRNRIRKKFTLHGSSRPYPHEYVFCIQLRT